MWLSHLGGKRSREGVNSLRGVSSRCSSFSSFHIGAAPFSLSLVPLPRPPPPPFPPATLLPAGEQVAPGLKRATREQQSGHQLQIPRANMRVGRPSSSVTRSVFVLPPGVSPSSPSLYFMGVGVVISLVLMCPPILFIWLLVWMAD